MKKDLYTEFNDYCEYEQHEVPDRGNDMNEMLLVMKRIDSTLQVICAFIAGIFLLILLK